MILQISRGKGYLYFINKVFNLCPSILDINVSRALSITSPKEAIPNSFELC